MNWDWLQPIWDSLPMTITCLFFFVGIISTALPILPGNVIVWLGILIHILWVPEHSVSWTFFAVATFLMILAQVLDLAASYYGARIFGASWRGGVGALAGIFIGIFILGPILPVIGLIIGPIVGAIAGEMLGGAEWKTAQKAGVGTIVGGLAAFLAKIFIALGTIAAFFFYKA